MVERIQELGRHSVHLFVGLRIVQALRVEESVLDLLGEDEDPQLERPVRIGDDRLKGGSEGLEHLQGLGDLLLDGLDLGGIADRSGRSVGVDVVDGCGADGCIPEGICHRIMQSASLRV